MERGSILDVVCEENYTNSLKDIVDVALNKEATLSSRQQINQNINQLYLQDVVPQRGKVMLKVQTQ